MNIFKLLFKVIITSFLALFTSLNKMKLNFDIFTQFIQHNNAMFCILITVLCNTHFVTISYYWIFKI